MGVRRTPWLFYATVHADPRHFFPMGIRIAPPPGRPPAQLADERAHRRVGPSTGPPALARQHTPTTPSLWGFVDCEAPHDAPERGRSVGERFVDRRLIQPHGPAQGHHLVTVGAHPGEGPQQGAGNVGPGRGELGVRHP